MHVSAYDEALGVPTEAAATLALRTQQIVGLESGLTETVDPFGGSYAVEALTDQVEREIEEIAQQVEPTGAVRWPASSTAGSPASSPTPPTAHARAVESGDRVVIGVNRFPSPSEPLEVFQIDPGVEEGQVAAVRRVRAQRDQSAVDARAAGGQRQPRQPATTCCRRRSVRSRPTPRSARSSACCARCTARGGPQPTSEQASPAQR